MTKETLRNYKHLKNEIRQLEETVQELEVSMTSPRSPQMDAMPRACPDGAGPTERPAIQHLQLIELYNEKLAVLRSEQMRIEKAIDKLEPVERLILRRRYLEGLTWEEVAVRSNYSWRQVHRIHGRALEHLRNL